MNNSMFHVFAACSFAGAMFITALVTARCPREHKWFGATFVPIIVGFTASYLWGRSVKNTTRAMICATTMYVAAAVFIALDLFAIFRIHDHNTVLVGLSGLMTQGLFLTFKAGRASSTTINTTV